MAKIGGSIVDPTPPYNSGSDSGRGITSRELNVTLTPDYGINTGKLLNVPDALSSGGDSSNPLDYAASLPFRGLGMAGQALGSGIKVGADIVGASPLGFIASQRLGDGSVGDVVGNIGKVFLDILAKPGEMVQDFGATLRLKTANGTLPPDIQAMVDSGASEESIIKYMRETGRSLANDRTVNLGLSLLLDPLNLTPFALGKVNLLKGLGKLGTVGAGIGAGAALGPVGAVAGGLTGYALGGRVGQKLAQIGWKAGARTIAKESGLELSAKAKAIQAFEAAGKEIPADLNKGQYLLYNEIDKAIFRPMRNVANGVKEGLKLKTGQLLLKAYGANVIDDFHKVATQAFGEDAAKLGLRRFAIAKTNSVIQAVSRSRVGEVEAAVDNVVENLDADVNKALQEYVDARYKGVDDATFTKLTSASGDAVKFPGSTDYVITKLADEAGEAGLEGRYGMSREEITAYMQDAAPGYGPRTDPGTGLRIVDENTTKQAAKNRLRNRLLQARMDTELVGYDPVKDAIRAASSNMDMIDNGLLDEVSLEVKKEAEFVGIAGPVEGASSQAAAKRAYMYAERLATELANASSDDLSRVAGRKPATPSQIDAIADSFFGGARVEGGKLVGGKYFDDAGTLSSAANISRQLSQRFAFARSTTYGFNINRMGNVRRVLHVASLFEKASLREREVYAKEISKALGKPVSVRELEQIIPGLKALGDPASYARPTFVKTTSLIDTKVEQWIAMFERLGQDGGLVASQYPDVSQSVIAQLNRAAAKGGPTAAAEAKKIWATQAAAAFEDVAAHHPGFKLSSGSVSAQQVKDFLTAAKNSSATTARATPKELSAIREAWRLLTGNSDEIDGIIAAAKRDGYELGIAPADNVIREPRLIATVEKQGLAVPEVATVDRPFIDLTSEFVDGLPDFANPQSYKVGGIRGAIQGMMAPIPQSLVSSSAAQRLQLMLRNRFTVDEIDEFNRRITTRAVQARVGTRGLSSDTLEDIMGGILQEKTGAASVKAAWAERVQALERAGIKSPDLQADVIKAFKGEYDISGYSQWISGSMKTAPGIGKFLANISENLYPTLKYKINPMFFAQELIESPFYAELRGMNRADMEAKLKAAGIDPREVRQMFGERAAAQAMQLHEQAFFSFTARSRGAADSALKEGLTAKNIIGENGILSQGWDFTASFKEQYRDLMAAADLAPKFQQFVQKNMPHEYTALHAKYGPDAFDQLVGWTSEYKRLQNAKFGGSAVNTMKAPGFGFAVNPSATQLAAILNDVRDVLPMHTADKFGALVQGGARPRIITSTFRAKFINAAQDAGYDVSSARTALDQLDNIAQRYALELNRVGPNLQFLKTEYDKALKTFGVEMRGLTAQLQLADVQKAIVQELMDAYIPGFSGTADASKIIEAIGNARKYGAKFATMGNLIEQIRIDAGDISTLGPGVRETIRETVKRYSSFAGERGQVVRSTQDILTDTTSNLLRDHAGEEAMFEAAKWSYAKSVDEMNKVNYFKSDRSWFERSINHPFLGLYPFSYMFGKALPELARFMFYKPFGMTAPGAGYVAYRKISDYISYNGLPPGWEVSQEKPDWQFLLTQLIPAVPTDMTVVTPHWFRSAVSTISRQGYDQYKATDLLGETTDWAARTGVGGFLQLAAKAGGELSGTAADFLTGKYNTDIGTFRK